MNAISLAPPLAPARQVTPPAANPGRESPRRPPLVPAVLAAVGWTVLLMLVMPVVSVLVVRGAGTTAPMEAAVPLVGLVGTGLLLAIPAVRRRVVGLELAGTGRDGLRRLAPLVVVAAGSLILYLATEGLPDAETLTVAVALSAGAGASEEVWRALVLRALGGRLRPWLALVATATVFGALHMMALSGVSLLHAGATAAFGVAAGAALLRGVPVVVVAGVHAAYDLLLMATMTDGYRAGLKAAESTPLTMVDLLAVAPLVLVQVAAATFGVRALRRALAAGG